MAYPKCSMSIDVRSIKVGRSTGLFVGIATCIGVDLYKMR